MTQHVFADDETLRQTIEGPRAFVTGWPVWHSRSPLIHGAWLKQFGLSGSYERLGIPPEEIGDFLADFAGNGFVGGNVTLPHKETVFSLVERRDAAAQAIGAINTLWLEEGKLTGGNTDAYGFAANLDALLPGWDAAEEALVLGAGGAARAVVFALLDRGIGRVRIVNRTAARAAAIAESFGPRVSGHGEDERETLLSRADLLVNTVPVPPKEPDEEKYGWSPPLPDLSGLSDKALVTDIVYVPLETPTIAAARARGLTVADGLGMLLHQAVPGFERWFGQRPTVDAALRALVVADIDREG
ncbi:shikimate dehydrogenase (NADP(+)) [Aureimonas sp. SA4125]|uniref:shikimate dehydrogenase n=1 Tax=Aureimonas sp. SA4125 TaxID=2826993 RepID=UPI001CC3BA79|nr:shikimate dehydrogenase [Aureimonas sp. SA4125]BDA86860.1 shikimate dehydrogenase (NADP(+)) [Aureimonas sp. SA4125]